MDEDRLKSKSVPSVVCVHPCRYVRLKRNGQPPSLSTALMHTSTARQSYRGVSPRYMPGVQERLGDHGRKG